MAISTNGQSVIVRTDRGLTIAGTRLTLYAVMDYLKAGWTAPMIQGCLGLTQAQISGALEYLDSHRDEVEQEYQTVLQQAESSRKYWEAKQRERSASTAESAPHAEPSNVREKLQDWKAKLESP